MSEPSTEQLAARRARRHRLLAFAAGLAALYAAGKASGLLDRLDSLEEVRALALSAGDLGRLLFVIGFAVGELLHVPGMIFVGAGALAYGRAMGFVLSALGALLSVSLSFWVVRRLGGEYLAEVERPWLRRALAHLDRHPVRTVFFLRLFLWLAPSLNYALGLTRIRFRDYLLGSALGLTGPLLAATLLVDRLTR